MTADELEEARGFVEWRLRAFVRPGEGEEVTREELRAAMQVVFPRLGWHLDRRGPGDLLDAARLFVTAKHASAAVLLPCTPRSLCHRYVAAMQLLRWVDAPWALEPDPWGGAQTVEWSWVEPTHTATAPKLTRPADWPTKGTPW